MTDNHVGTCARCEKRCKYVRISSTMSVWVHEESGDFISEEYGRHDCNTYIVRESDK